MEVTRQIGRVDQGRSIQAKTKMLTRIVAHNVDYFSLCCLNKQCNKTSNLHRQLKSLSYTIVKPVLNTKMKNNVINSKTAVCGGFIHVINRFNNILIIACERTLVIYVQKFKKERKTR